MDQPSLEPQDELRSELGRLNDKLSTTDDPDITRVLQARVAEIESELARISAAHLAAEVHENPAEAVMPSKEEEAMYRAELAQCSQKLYSEEDPDKRNELKERVKELQALLRIDVARLAGSELSTTAIPDLSVAAKR